MWSSNLDSSSTFEGGFLDNSRKGGQEDVKVRRIQTLVPVMIGNLLSVSSVDETKLWGIPARMFSVLGVIRNIEETTTKISYDIEDQTGTITALKWLEADRKANDRSIKVNTYFRVTGLLREQNDKRHILILRMSPLKSLNELTCHLLEVTYAMLKAESMCKKGTEFDGQSNSTVSNGTTKESPYYGMTEDQSLIYKIIHTQNETETGIKRSEIKAQVPQRLLSSVDQILDFLVSEGHIYTTSTDDHFKTT